MFAAAQPKAPYRSDFTVDDDDSAKSHMSLKTGLAKQPVASHSLK